MINQCLTRRWDATPELTDRNLIHGATSLHFSAQPTDIPCFVFLTETEVLRTFARHGCEQIVQHSRLRNIGFFDTGSGAAHDSLRDLFIPCFDELHAKLLSESNSNPTGQVHTCRVLRHPRRSP